MSSLADWTGLRIAAYLEPKPGIAPPPSHLADVVRIVRAEGVKALLVENYYDTKSAEAVARHTGAAVVTLPGDVGGAPGTETYEKYVDTLVKRISEAVK